MNIDFTQVMSQKTEEELIKIITIQRADYQTEAIAAAEMEIKKREISTVKIELIKKEIVFQSEKQSSINEDTVNSMVRLIHMVVDFIAFMVIAIIMSIIVDLFVPTQNQTILSIISLLLFITSFFFYYIFLEFKYQKTLGKLLTKTVVIRKDKNQILLNDIIIRTICRFIPFDQISFIFTKNGFHDYLSNTTVIKEKTISKK